MEKQIKEMTDVITKADPKCWAKAIAVALYNAGYRKQVEGKRLVADTLREDEDGTIWSSYRCSECGCMTEAYYSDPRDISRFCPNCGARMNGGV